MNIIKSMLTVGIFKKKTKKQPNPKTQQKQPPKKLFSFWADHQKDAILLTKVSSHSLVKSNFHKWFITIAIN